jgi:hypothetical protein
MAQQSSSPHESFPHELHSDSDHQVLLFPTCFAAGDPTDLPAQPAGRPATTQRARVSTRVIRQVVVLQVAGRLAEVVEDLDLSLQQALADEPRGVVCDLTAVLGGFEPAAVEVLATAGRHVRDWPGIPAGVACPDPQVREALRAHPLGKHVIVTESLFSAISAVLATPTLTIERLRLAPHPTAPRAAQNFVTRTLLDWQLNPVISVASLVASDLVSSSTISAGTDITLSVAWNRDALRLTVRDHGPSRRQPGPDPHQRGLTVVAGLSRAFGVLPTANDGQMVWAILDAPRPGPPTSHHRPAAHGQEALIINDAQALAEQHSLRIIEGRHR